MISGPAEESSTQHADQFQDGNSPKPGWFKPKLLKPTEWWPVTMIAVPATMLACLPQASRTIVKQAECLPQTPSSALKTGKRHQRRHPPKPKNEGEQPPMTYEMELEKLNRPPAPSVPVQLGHATYGIRVAIIVCPERHLTGEGRVQDAAVDYSSHEITFIALCDDQHEEEADEIAWRYMDPKNRNTSISEIATTLSHISDLARMDGRIAVKIGAALARESRNVRNITEGVWNELRHIQQARKHAVYE